MAESVAGVARFDEAASAMLPSVGHDGKTVQVSEKRGKLVRFNVFVQVPVSSMSSEAPSSVELLCRVDGYKRGEPDVSVDMAMSYSGDVVF
jgi:hypothetical protein